MTCKHLEAYLRPDDNDQYAYCPTCEKLIRFYIIFNNLMEEVRKLRGEIDGKETSNGR
jgi:hypothetical protein